MPPPGDLVFFCQPDSHYVDMKGPIQIAEGRLSGHALNPGSLVNLQAVARLMLKAFCEGLGGPLEVSGMCPWSWSTSDSNFARRVTKVMRNMGMEDEALLSMPVGSTEEIASCDEDWANLIEQTTGLLHGR